MSSVISTLSIHNGNFIEVILLIGEQIQNVIQISFGHSVASCKSTWLQSIDTCAAPHTVWELYIRWELMELYYLDWGTLTAERVRIYATSLEFQMKCYCQSLTGPQRYFSMRFLIFLQIPCQIVDLLRFPIVCNMIAFFSISWPVLRLPSRKLRRKI